MKPRKRIPRCQGIKLAKTVPSQIPQAKLRSLRSMRFLTLGGFTRSTVLLLSLEFSVRRQKLSIDLPKIKKVRSGF